MFKAYVAEHFGPFCGMGGYGGASGTAMHRSPKRAFELAKANKNLAERTANIGGGVPILGEAKLWKDGKLILNKFS